MPKALVNRKWRLVTRFGALAFNGFNKRSLFSANISPRAYEDAEIEIQIRTKDVLAQKPIFITSIDLVLAGVFRMLVLVSDVENAFVRAGNETANDHPFDEQMRQVLHDEAILDRSRLALIGVADYVLFIVGTIADYLPFVSGGESGSAHTAQAARFQLRDDPGEVSGLNQAIQNAILRSADVRIGMELLAQPFRTCVRQRFAA